MKNRAAAKRSELKKRNSTTDGRRWTRIQNNCARGDAPYLEILGCRRLQQSDVHRDHKPDMPKSWKIKEGFFLFRGRSKPKLINSEICVFEFLSFGFVWRFMERRMAWLFAMVRLLTSAATIILRGV